MKALFLFFLLIPFYSIAQDKMLLVEGVSPNLYITHNLEPKESFYSIGRLYNVSPKEIAPFNNLKLESGLQIGQSLKVPLNSSNFFQSGKAGKDETFVPVYYVVKEKEGLYRVGLNNNNLPVDVLKKWNNISGDGIGVDARLIVGFLKVNKQLSELSRFGIGQNIDNKTIAVKEPLEKKPATIVKPELPAPPITKAEPEKKETVKQPAESNPVVEVKEVKPEKKEPVAVKKVNTEVEPVKTSTAKIGPGGAFKEIYDKQVANLNTELAEGEGIAGIFKSTSGWSDKKYYCLHNNATQGTIIKITNPATGKSIYAKVLDLIPDLKQNDGLMILVSNATADVLGAVDGNFNCTISYPR